MKRIFSVIAFLLVCSLAMASGPSSVQTDQNHGYIDQVTYVYTIPPTSYLDLDTVFSYANMGLAIPKGFKFKLYGGDVVIGPKGDVSTGTYHIGDYVASGTVYPGWTGLKLPAGDDYNLRIAPCGATVTVVITSW